MQRNSDGGIYNKDEDSFIIRKILGHLMKVVGYQSRSRISVGIISFYSEQVNNFKKLIKEMKLDSHSILTIEISTVDGFQGSEKDIIILSCVRSNTNRGGEFFIIYHLL